MRTRHLAVCSLLATLALACGEATLSRGPGLPEAPSPAQVAPRPEAPAPEAPAPEAPAPEAPAPSGPTP